MNGCQIVSWLLYVFDFNEIPTIRVTVWSWLDGKAEDSTENAINIKIHGKCKNNTISWSFKCYFRIWMSVSLMKLQSFERFSKALVRSYQISLWMDPQIQTAWLTDSTSTLLEVLCVVRPEFMREMTDNIKTGHAVARTRPLGVRPGAPCVIDWPSVKVQSCETTKKQTVCQPCYSKDRSSVLKGSDKNNPNLYINKQVYI